jgi:hypothetical protein
MAAALYDRLVQAGWDGEVVESQVLCVAEPDLAMQDLLKVAFPSFQPQLCSFNSSSMTVAGSSTAAAAASSQPSNLGAVALPAFSRLGTAGRRVSCSQKSEGGATAPANPRQQQEQFDVILGYLPHEVLGRSGISSHLMACSAVDMLKPGGHALLLFTSRWLCAKSSMQWHHAAARRALAPYLGDVWGVISTTGRQLLRYKDAKNSGQQLSHFFKGSVLVYSP